MSLSSIEDFEKLINEYKEQLPNVAYNIVDRLADEGLENNLKSTKKKETKIVGTKVIGGFETTDPIDTYKEFGTGITGANNPHLSEVLAKVGWIYDVNQHGEKGWIYPKGDGTFGWTKGISAQKKFYQACRRVEQKFDEVAIEEIAKIIGGVK